MKINKVNLLSYSIAFMLVSFTNPVYLWGNASLILMISFAFFLFNFFNNGVAIKRKKLYPLIIFFIILTIYIFFPFREYDEFKLYYFVFLITCYMIFFLKDEILVSARMAYVNIVVFISILTIFSSILFFLKVPFPYITIASDTRVDTVILYFFSIYLDSQLLNLGSLSIYRANGWFLEPGHYGIYLGIALSFIDNILKSNKGKILLLATFLTFSATAYFFMFIVVVFKYFSIKRSIWLFSFFILCFSVYTIPVINKFINDVILFKFQNESVLDARTVGIEYIDVNNYSRYLFGRGLSYIDHLDIVVSDYRRFIVSTGYIGFFLLVVMYICIVYKAILYKKNYIFIGLILVFLVLMHRSWMFYLGFIWIYLALIISSLSIAKDKDELF